VDSQKRKSPAKKKKTINTPKRKAFDHSEKKKGKTSPTKPAAEKKTRATQQKPRQTDSNQAKEPQFPRKEDRPKT